MKMLAIQNKTLKLKTFVPEKMCTNEDTVVVIGHDEAEASNRKNLRRRLGACIHFSGWKNCVCAGFYGYKSDSRCFFEMKVT